MRPRAKLLRTILAGICLTAIGPVAAASAKQAVAVGRGGAVVSDSTVATDAGLKILRHGGSAADAAVAVASTLGVTDPLVAGIGGGGYFVYYDARTHRVYTIDGRETAPARDGPDMFIDPLTGEPLAFPTAVTSGLSVGVPGTLMTWRQALDRWGRFPLAADLRPAEQAAQSGFTIDPAVSEEIRENQARFEQFSSTKALFLPGGVVPPGGTVLRNPDLARTYRQIGRHGVGALYGGPIGADVVQTVNHLPLAPDATLTPRPGPMLLSDLAHYSAPFVAPTHVNYRGYDVYSMAPSSSGGTTVGESLNILSNFNLSRETPVQALHHYLEATRLAFADRNRYVGDPRFVDVPVAQLLSVPFGRQRACLIDPGHALTSPVAPGDPFADDQGCTPKQPINAGQADHETHTNHFVVADSQGDVVSYTNTIEQLGGSGMVVPGRGFLVNNELTDFDFTGVEDPNLPAAGKRPRSSMSPTIVLRHGRPFMAVGAAGGATIITTVLGILVNRIDFGMTLPDAIAAPRASQRNSNTTQAEPAFIALPTTPGLEKLGQQFAITDTSPLDSTIKIPPTIGVATGLELLGHGTVLAAGEPSRRGGSAAGVVRPVR
ncbi:MAG TPA: gamma-glutamyltransferase [Solirubrobacteraceae bacterium]|nr:gamma-glutamyltransferase [Solirubrobacteraceae bacterium]